MKRTSSLKRGTKVLARHARLKPGKPKRRQPVPPAAIVEAARRSRGRCVVCDQRGPIMDPHHVLPVRLFPELVARAENIVLVCRDCHEAHENASRRIRWAELPGCAITLAYATSGTAALFLERTYPRG